MAVVGGIVGALALLGGCSDRESSVTGGRPEITVFAAASLRDVMAELAPQIEQDLGAKLVINLGSSGDLARQIISGGKADVFLSADEREMDRLAALDLIESGTRRDFLANQLVVIEPFENRPEWKSNFSLPFKAAQLAGPAIVRLSLANTDTVPAGRYAKGWLEAHGVWNDVATRVLPGIDVRAALAAVESGGAQAGIVYRTDAERSKRVHVVFEVPRAQGPQIVYPRAALRAAHDLQLARRFIALIESPTAAVAFERHGFVVLAPAR